MYTIQNLVEIWFARSAVVMSESGVSLAAILEIDVTASRGGLVWVKFDDDTIHGHSHDVQIDGVLYEILQKKQTQCT